MKKTRLLFILVFSALALWAVLFFWQDKLPQIEKILAIETQIFTPPPLRAEEESPQSFLTIEGVITLTNIQRNNQGLASLKENSLLDAAARAKAQDMFKNQYFGHESPSGLGVGDLAENHGYDFIIIGENLALGNFENDQTLVQAWMDSPGHRANILNGKFQEIGVAVVMGIFEGKSTWLAVQHFGLPLASCPQPSSALKEQIQFNQVEIKNLQAVINNLNTELKSTRRRDKDKIDEYNSLVSQYNALVRETKSLINQYNSQVSLFNNCLSSGL